MSRLIDADALLEGREDHEMISTHLIWNAPTIEAEPVRRGKWEYVDYGGFGNWHCTACREICICNGDFDYCPNCGAKMDGGNINGKG